MPRALAALNLPRRIPDAIVYARSVAAAMSGNPAFPSPTPPIATLEADLAALEAAHVRTLTRALGTTSERDAKLATVQTHLACLRTYVQQVADTSPGEAEVLIASAGMSLKRPTGRPRPVFVAKEGLVSGTVRLVAKAPPTRASHDWQRSLDGTAWIDLERTIQARTELSGLVPGTWYLFRHRALTREGVGDWSQVVSLLVR